MAGADLGVLDQPGAPTDVPSEHAPACVSVVIVNWNGASVIGACLASLLQQDYSGPIEIIVVDNASTDSSLSVLRGYGNRLRVVKSSKNLGFGKGNNVGFRTATGRYCLFLNPDTEFLAKDGLRRLVASLKDPRIGIVAPRLLDPDGTTQQSCSSVPTLINLTLSMLALPRLLPDAWRRRFSPVLWSHDRSTYTGWVSGACVLMRTDEYRRVGGFSERTFMYGEDLELGYRVGKFGWRVYYEWEVQVLHTRDHSSAQRWTDAGTAAKAAEGELMFLRERYSRRCAEMGRWMLWAGYGARARLLGRLGRHKRAAIYAAMAHALRTAPTVQARHGWSRSSLEEAQQ
jgi:N-acetylglucosaminyl-diphospho-decaprenol L-rhamnosyltransferase